MISFAIRMSPVLFQTFSADKIIKYNLNDEVSIIGKEFPIGTFEVECITDIGEDINLGLIGNSVRVKSDNYVGLFFLDDIAYLGARRYRLKAVTVAGLLDKVWHKGGIYAGTPLSTLVIELLGTTNIASYDVLLVIDENLEDIDVYGYLPYDTSRNNLQRLMVAYGFIVRTSQSGSTVFVEAMLPEIGTPISPNDDNIYIGASVEFPEKIKTIDVTEHSYRQTILDVEEALWDNTHGSNTANRDLVVFDGPHYDLKTDGPLTIDESGVNYAIVSGTGILSGRPYTHSERALSVTTSGAVQSNMKSVLSVADVGVITGVNSWNVALRLLNYFTNAKILTGRYIGSGSHLAETVTLPDPSTEGYSTGLIERVSHVLSQSNANAVSLLANYTPGPFGNNFQNAARITASSSWTVPAGVTRLRVLIVGGGQGGQGGLNGQAGYGGSDLKTSEDGDTNENDVTNLDIKASLYYSRQQVAAEGGAAGTPGLPGKILVTDVDVTSGESLAITVGGRGTRGNHNGGLGAFGGDSSISGTFGTLSSADGERYDIGFADLLNGDVYGLPGEEGIKGGNGGLSCTADRFGAFGASSKYNGLRVVDGDTRLQAGLSGLPTWSLPSVTEIPALTFAALTNLTLVILPDGLETIGNGAFNIAGTGQVVLPSSLTSIGSGVITSKTVVKYIKGASEAWEQCKIHKSNKVEDSNYMHVLANGMNPPPRTDPIVADGPIGDHLTWSLDSAGVLWISGYGKMWTYAERVAWYSDHPTADNYDDYNSSITAIAFGEPEGYVGGAGGAGAYYEALTRRITPRGWTRYLDTYLCRVAAGGGGGGASNAASGSAGGNGSITENGSTPATPTDPPYNPPAGTITGGNGGAGAAASDPSSAYYGCGGAGGNGGGAGGNGGGAIAYVDRADYNVNSETVVPGTGGVGGAGSYGGAGGAGIVVIYY